MTISGEQAIPGLGAQAVLLPSLMREMLPLDVVDRGTCPFSPPSGLRERQGQGVVRPVKLANGATAWVITGIREARTILSDQRVSSDRIRHPDAASPQPDEPADVPPMGSRTDGMFVMMDPPEHTRLRRLLTGQFTVRRMKALEEHIREIAVRHIEAMQAAGTEADLVAAFALPIPSLVISELLGVDYAERERFQSSTSAVLNAATPRDERARAGLELFSFIQELVTAKRAAPGDDIVSGLIREADPPLTDAQLTDIAMVLLGAGHETTANMLGFGTFALLEHPDQLAALQADPTLLDNAVEELLRVLSIAQLGVTRVTTEDVTVDGVEIPAGATVIIGLPEANRDARHWDDPDRFDVRRPRVPHLAFGHGVHQCLGQQLARAEMKVAFEELIMRLPNLRLAVPAEEVPLRNEMAVFGVHSLPVTWS